MRKRGESRSSALGQNARVIDAIAARRDASRKRKEKRQRETARRDYLRSLEREKTKKNHKKKETSVTNRNVDRVLRQMFTSRASARDILHWICDTDSRCRI